MHWSELNETGDTVSKGDQNEPVERRGVVHFRQVRPRVDSQRREGQHRRDS